jgi:hypothetical protein
MGIFKRQSITPREFGIQTDHRETDFETGNLLNILFSCELLLGVVIDVRFRDRFLELYRIRELLCECLVPEKGMPVSVPVFINVK